MLINICSSLVLDNVFMLLPGWFFIVDFWPTFRPTYLHDFHDFPCFHNFLYVYVQQLRGFAKRPDHIQQVKKV